MLQIPSLKGIWLLCLCIIICGCEIRAPIGTTESEVDRARSALVIGNGNYVNAAPLTNATNDAGDFATILRSLNYEVREHLNMDAAGMRSALQEFGLSLAGERIINNPLLPIFTTENTEK